jgi:hypothetical protein
MKKPQKKKEELKLEPATALSNDEVNSISKNLARWIEKDIVKGQVDSDKQQEGTQKIDELKKV